MEENIDKKHSAKPVGALVLGILSVLFTLFWYISLPCGILSIIFGSKASRKLGSKLGKAGLILGIIGLALFTFIYVSMALILILSRY